ncbi:hypothetical protein QAD02_015867 [Eretmocerus hayati]|uniref:Uncharacterized protein n=1 Tax=Eretmocerus hayati TaxID=131215 RepID=A0ACC2P907_9HYME|nr:hypothetical protein QAD02_015867 [Eretmocerus hayati]
MKLLTLACIALPILADQISSYHGIMSNILTLIKNIFPLTSGVAKLINDYDKFYSSELNDTSPTEDEEFDFIIVGAGSAGCTMAARLSEMNHSKILLIESGGHENILMNVPLLALYLYFDKTYHWDYMTEPSEEYCLAFKNHQCRLPMGKVMGGTSSMNFMLATRGNKRDYDGWAEMTDDKSWSYDEMLKYFKRLENFTSNSNYDHHYHNSHGPVKIGDVPYRTVLADAFVKAGIELGLPPVDYNGRKQTSFSYIQTTQNNGERMSANRAYLHPLKNRKNLIVSMNTQATKVIIDRATKTAGGVEVILGGEKMRVRAKKEVILSAGAIGSPKLLMLSGIGPRDHLQEMGIKTIVDAPVGENLMDHIAFGGLTFLINQTVSILINDIISVKNPAILDYLYHKIGPITMPMAIEGLGYLNVDRPTSKNDTPNIELIFGSMSFGAHYLIHKPFGMSEKYWTKSFLNLLNRHAWIIWPVLIQPKSRGRVLLRSTNPLDKPKIFPNYFSDPEDMRVGIKSIRISMKVAKTKAMQKFGSKIHKIIIPGCEKHIRDSDAFWECAFRSYTMTIWHHSGTCKMGRADDPSTVVNPKLQVKEIKGLRVVDASIMPKIPTAHLNIPTIVIAEKASDMVKSDWDPEP